MINIRTMNKRRFERAFALPTVVITAVILMMLLVGGLSSVTSVRRGLSEQQYATLAREASEAGLAYAQSCVDKNLGENVSTGWGYDTTTNLQTGNLCSGSFPSGTDCVNSPTAKPDQCYVYYDATSSPGVRSQFVVAPLKVLGDSSYNLAITGTVTLYNGSGVSYKTYTQELFTRNATDVRYGIVSGNDTVCSIQAGALYCWGKNSDGQVGIGSTSSVSTPQLVTGMGALSSSWSIVAVGTGISHTCAIASISGAITDAKQVLCWGDNSLGQFGIASPTSRTTPYLVNTLSSNYAIDISGRDHNCILTVSSTDSTLRRSFCWGKNNNYQAGEKDDGTHPDPKRIANWLETRDTSAVKLRSVQQITSVSGGNSCGINDSTTMDVYCMGNANHGMLGNNTTADSDRANWVQITSTSTTLGKAKKVAINNGRACALSQYSANGTTTSDSNYHVWCWGTNWNYDTGKHDYRIDSGTAFYSVEDRLRAKRVHTDLTSGTRTCVYDATVGASGSYDCATIAAAGHTATNLFNANIADIAVTDTDMCLLVNGIVYCSGYNQYGQLGQGTTSTITPGSSSEAACSTMSACPLQKADQALPVLGLLQGQIVSGLAGGNGHFCAITIGHIVYCWGKNNYGQIGDGTFNNAPSPVRSVMPRDIIY